MQAGNKTYIDEILFMSPMGAQLTFNPLGVHLKGLSVREKIHQNDAETIKYGDIEFTEKWYVVNSSKKSEHKPMRKF